MGPFFAPSDGPIRRVLGHPEFDAVVCTTEEQIHRIFPGANAYFGHHERKIYFAKAKYLYHSTISHEFIHADYFFRRNTAPINTNGFQPNRPLPFYPDTEENIELYKMALDEGHKRVNNFKQLKQKRKRHEELSIEELKLFKNYEDASKGSLTQFLIEAAPSKPIYNYLLVRVWQQQMPVEVEIMMHGVVVRAEVVEWK